MILLKEYTNLLSLSPIRCGAYAAFFFMYSKSCNVLIQYHIESSDTDTGQDDLAEQDGVCGLRGGCGLCGVAGLRNVQVRLTS